MVSLPDLIAGRRISLPPSPGRVRPPPWPYFSVAEHRAANTDANRLIDLDGAPRPSATGSMLNTAVAIRRVIQLCGK